MDIKIVKEKGIKAYFGKKGLPYVGGTLLLVLVVWMVFRDNSSSLQVDSQILTVADVKQGEFNDYVRVNGQVQPITTVQLSPLENGIVEKLMIEEGAKVKKGDVLVVLSNNTLDLSIMDAEAQLAEKDNFLRNTKVTMEQEKLLLRQEMLQLDLDVTRKKRKYEQQEELYENRLVAKEEYLQAKEDYEFAAKKRLLIHDRQMQDSIYRNVQFEQLDKSLENMKRNMQLIYKRKSNLQIKSPIDGELGLLDVVLGQSISMGQKIGQINDLSDFKIEAMIDEHYIDRVRAGLSATFERQSESFTTTLRKVYPEVRNGQFKADFNFTGTRPENIRTGQTYYLNLQLGQPEQAIFIPRGSFYQATGGLWIYVVSHDGTTARRRQIKIGRQNPQYYEVLEGLEAGEKVIVSNYENFGENDVLILNK